MYYKNWGTSGTVGTLYARFEFMMIQEYNICILYMEVNMSNITNNNLYENIKNIVEI